MAEPPDEHAGISNCGQKARRHTYPLESLDEEDGEEEVRVGVVSRGMRRIGVGVPDPKLRWRDDVSDRVNRQRSHGRVWRSLGVLAAFTQRAAGISIRVLARVSRRRAARHPGISRGPPTGAHGQCRSGRRQHGQQGERSGDSPRHVPILSPSRFTCQKPAATRSPRVQFVAPIQSVATEAATHEVEDDQHHDDADRNDARHIHPRERGAGRSEDVALVTPPVRGHAPRFVHPQRRRPAQ